MVYSRLLLPPLAATLQQHLADRRDALRDEADRRGYQQQGRRRRHRTPPGRRSTRRAASSTSQSRARRVFSLQYGQDLGVLVTKRSELKKKLILSEIRQEKQNLKDHQIIYQKPHAM